MSNQSINIPRDTRNRDISTQLTRLGYAQPIELDGARVILVTRQGTTITGTLQAKTDQTQQSYAWETREHAAHVMTSARDQFGTWHTLLNTQYKTITIIQGV